MGSIINAAKSLSVDCGDGVSVNLLLREVTLGTAVRLQTLTRRKGNEETAGNELIGSVLLGWDAVEGVPCDADDPGYEADLLAPGFGGKRVPIPATPEGFNRLPASVAGAVTQALVKAIHNTMGGGDDESPLPSSGRSARHTKRTKSTAP